MQSTQSREEAAMADENQDMAAMLAELRRKGMSARQLATVGTDWGIACDDGAHPDLAVAARAAGLEGRSGDTAKST